jgi:Aminopeptidase N
MIILFAQFEEPDVRILESERFKGLYYHYDILSWPDVETTSYDIRKYHIKMTIYGGQIQNAEIGIKVKARENLDTIKLNLVDIVLDSLKDGNGNTLYHFYSGSSSNRLLVIPYNLSANDTAWLWAYYHGLPATSCSGFGGGLTIRGDTFVYADNEPYNLRCWVPSWDQPYEKAEEGVEFEISARADMEVVANGVLLDTQTVGSLKRWHYRHNYPIAPYLITFAIRNLQYNSWTWNYGPITMPVRAYIPYGSGYTTWGSNLTQMLTAFSNRYGIYPFYTEKYEQSIVLPGGWAMEDQTNSFFGGAYGNSTQAHELAHHWWGNMVTCGTFKDIWLNEGFATYSELIWKEDSGGFTAYKNYYITRVENYFFSYASFPGLPVYNPGPSIYDIFSIYTYQKGAAVLHMLRYILNKDTSLFFGALRHYRLNHEYSYATTAEFINDVITYTGMDLTWFFDQWVYQPGWPIYDVRWAKNNLGGIWRLYIRIAQVQPSSAPIYKMPLEIKVNFPSGDTLITVWDSLAVQNFIFDLSREPVSIVFDPDSWVLEQHTVSYDPSLLARQSSEFEGGKVEIYDISGRRVGGFQGRGVYFVKDGKTLRKVIRR